MDGKNVNEGRENMMSKMVKKGTGKLAIFLLVLALVAGAVLAWRPGLTNASGDAAQGDPETVLRQRLDKAIVLYAGSTLALVENEETQVDQQNGSITPYVKQGRVFVPLRFIAESLQAKIAWERGTSAVRLTVGGESGKPAKTVKIFPGDAQMMIDGKAVKLDAVPEIIDGRTFVPVRAISEAFGKKVFYDRGLIIISEKEAPFNKETEKTLLDALIRQVNNLPKVGSAEQLQKLLANTEAGDWQRRRGQADFGPILDVAVSEVAGNMASGQSAQKKMMEAEVSSDYSTTNVQVQGVDEADIVKTDGEYLYHVNNKRVLITKAYPAEEMAVVSTLSFPDQDFQPQELYVDERYLVVIGRKPLYYIMKPAPVEPQSEAKKTVIWPPRRYQDEVLVAIYDHQDKTNIKKLREVSLEGSYLSSRKIGSYLYFVANCPAYYALEDGQEGKLAPVYRDTALQDDYLTVSFKEICYIPPIRSANYLLVAGLNLERPEEKINLSTLLGAGDEIYVSAENLYVALQSFSYRVLDLISPMTDSGVISISPVNRQTSHTEIYKFSLDKGKVTYLAKGEVPGTLLNQFSMDEHKGYLRVATTVGQTWGAGEDQSRNNVYILDDSMSLVGKLEGIAPGEQLYASRFMGDRAYLVTFKDTDPFFVLDLKEPTKPRVLGALKIPGYSDYLHPYDENHIIGFGKDTIELPVKGLRGSGEERTQAYYQGMKLAVFDVTDVTKPRELFREVIGDRGTDSELLRNHKALLWDREKELLAFPVRVMEVPEEEKRPDSLQYGQFTFQGAYVYQLNLQDGFVLRGKITHLNAEELLKAGYYTVDQEKEIRRILYIKDTLYTLSDGMLKAHGLAGLEERGSLSLR